MESSKEGHPVLSPLENTHYWGKYHCTAGLQLYKYGFNCFITTKIEQHRAEISTYLANYDFDRLANIGFSANLNLPICMNKNLLS